MYKLNTMRQRADDIPLNFFYRVINLIDRIAPSYDDMQKVRAVVRGLNLATTEKVKMINPTTVEGLKTLLESQEEFRKIKHGRREDPQAEDHLMNVRLPNARGPNQGPSRQPMQNTQGFNNNQELQSFRPEQRVWFADQSQPNFRPENWNRTIMNNTGNFQRTPKEPQRNYEMSWWKFWNNNSIF